MNAASHPPPMPVHRAVPLIFRFVCAEDNRRSTCDQHTGRAIGSEGQLLVGAISRLEKGLCGHPRKASPAQLLGPSKRRLRVMEGVGQRPAENEVRKVPILLQKSPVTDDVI